MTLELALEIAWYALICGGLLLALVEWIKARRRGDVKAWWRLRAWWHAQLYHPVDVTPDGIGGFLVECTCGGYGQLRRNGDGSSTVTDATCPLWRWRWKCRPEIPKARALP